jgi:hypothetical protein
MPTSVRVAVVLTVLGAWLAVVGAQTIGFFLGKSDLPNVALLAVPGTVVLAVAPWPARRPPATTPPPTPAREPSR